MDRFTSIRDQNVSRPILRISSDIFHQLKRVIFAIFVCLSITYPSLTQNWNVVKSSYVTLWLVLQTRSARRYIEVSQLFSSWISLNTDHVFGILVHILPFNSNVSFCYRFYPRDAMLARVIGMVCGHLGDQPSRRQSSRRQTNSATTNSATRFGQLGDKLFPAFHCIFLGL